MQHISTTYFHTKSPMIPVFPCLILNFPQLLRTYLRSFFPGSLSGLAGIGRPISPAATSRVIFTTPRSRRDSVVQWTPRSSATLCIVPRRCRSARYFSFVILFTSAFDFHQNSLFTICLYLRPFPFYRGIGIVDPEGLCYRIS